MRANTMNLKDIIALLHIDSINKQIAGYFGYYAGKFDIEKSDKTILITIPMKEGSRSLDRYFIKVLLDNGYIWHDCFLLGEIYLYKTI